MPYQVLIDTPLNDEIMGMMGDACVTHLWQGEETDPALLSGLARQALQDRLCIQISETDFLVSCVASPICDRTGQCVATISIVLPEHKVVEKRDYYAGAVRRASERIETALGWRDP